MKETLKQFIGNILIMVQPKKAEELSQNGMTLIINDKLSLDKRLIRLALLKRIEKEQDFDTLAEYHRNYWVNQGTDYFSLTEDNFETVFLPDCSFVFDELKNLLARDPHQYNMITEIGTGNGDILNYLSSKFTEINHFTGIDLSQEQIDINNKRFLDNNRLNFVASDGFEWVEQHGQPNSIFVTSRGVLEYFTQKRLEDFFKTLATLKNVIFVAIEPNGIDHDFEQNPNSQIYGNERSFSHNYASLFQQAGFDIQHDSRKAYEDNDHVLSFIIAQISDGD